MKFQLQNDMKMAELTILQSLRFAFGSPDGFLEKGEIYLSAVQTFRQLQEPCMVKSLEIPILLMIKEKLVWKIPEEMILVARIYQAIFETR